ncbi:MAG: cardiolipin synthase [Gammaproteobacteria bacterium]
MDNFNHPLAITTLAHVLIVFAIGIRVVMKRSAPGVAFAWLLLIAMLPFAGALLYLLIGERRVGPERRHRIDALAGILSQPGGDGQWANLTDVDWSCHPRAAAGLNQLGCNVAGSPTVRGNDIELYSDPEKVLQAIARDIDKARTGVSMSFYIWNEGGGADDVLEAAIRAAERGVACRILVDALGARPWLKGRQPQRLRAAGVQVRPALPVGLFRSFIGRTDLRLHRKLVVIDEAVAWTGSMNLVDPRMFKQGAGVGEWVDAMVRLRGSVVAPLGVTVLGDWMLETGTPIKELAQSAGLHHVEPHGTADIQVVPSGPGETGDGLLQMLLALINAAHEELVLTTPYLVPDDSMLRALRGAAGRGVKVKVIVPERVDSLLTRHASRSYFDDLLSAGIEIFLYREGLLHTKSIVADGSMSMFGTVNLDMRSLWLNYEVALFVYDPEFAKKLRALQQSYVADSRRLDPAEWAARSSAHRFLEDTFRLVSPIL